MARLFITPRELDFISDITKEVIKDVAGQKVFYYRIREDLSNTHDIYSEAIEKVFDPPIEVDALVEWNETSVTTNNFGIDVVKSNYISEIEVQFKANRSTYFIEEVSFERKEEDENETNKRKNRKARKAD